MFVKVGSAANDITQVEGTMTETSACDLSFKSLLHAYFGAAFQQPGS